MRNKQNHILRTAACANLANSEDITCPADDPGRNGYNLWGYQDDASEVVHLGSGTHGEEIEKLADRFLLGAPEIIDAPLFPKRQRSV